jgi:protein-L-isoaspartate(D-aspartate) O-methyltransferase
MPSGLFKSFLYFDILCREDVMKTGKIHAAPPIPLLLALLLMIFHAVSVEAGGTREGPREGTEDSRGETGRTQADRPGSGDAAEPETDARFPEARAAMVERQIAARGVRNPKVLEVMGKVPRHEFVPRNLQGSAYNDHPLPIGHGQTISQPYIVAYMTEILGLSPGEKVLEIGTGSGYQAAVLAEITDKVYTVEIIEELGLSTENTLKRLGYGSVNVKIGDGYFGWEEHAPFDAVIVTAAAGHIPPPLLAQLAPGGRMIIPVGGIFDVQALVHVTKRPDGSVSRRQLLPVRFVPMTGAGMGRPGN